ncbi:hypothetical protein [Natrialba sp. SSL1]|uniref:hypothetical protein n=1 Tax=Natrialba sp. SSL1 TaxID=1869245 RepID=UPI0008F81AF9|nr:hypothetical protein [Natrialba sp. SSL1]OIB59150.1 hypothetical protein BBD46_00255 [Natrialba sp. SSL1]
MTSIRNQLESAVGVGERFRVALEERDGEFVAAHPLESSPLPIVVGEKLPAELDAKAEAAAVPIEVTVEITDRVRDGRVVGRVVEWEEGRDVREEQFRI